MRGVFAVIVSVSLVACSGSSTSTSSSGSSGSGSTTGGTTTGASATGSSGGSTGGPPQGAKRIFVTSASYAASALGGRPGADQKCNLSAQSVNLGGTWVAILSDGNAAAFDRINDVGPWYLLDGTKVFNNKAGLYTTPLAVIGVDERGATHGHTGGDPYVWTGTHTGGAIGSTCMAWTDSSGVGTAGDLYDPSTWVETSVPTYCSESHRLYCIEQ